MRTETILLFYATNSFWFQAGKGRNTLHPLTEVEQGIGEKNAASLRNVVVDADVSESNVLQFGGLERVVKQLHQRWVVTPACSYTAR